MKLRFTPKAVRDLADIADYIFERNPNAALRVRAAILEALQDLVLFPELGRRQKLAGVRKLVIRRYPYLVYYRLDRSADEIAILTIRHSAQDRPYEDA
ncbi:MAG TPA: type II toxin-antitoxin system RelE/ParE family toxin [Xanthobacteraceae bacterium]|nr:type II toxin-antitoxin system RelE/ParE family toxin [Xanthobacteraceae bacterium]